MLAAGVVVNYNMTLMEHPDIEAIFTDLTRDLPVPTDSSDLRYFLDDEHTESIDHIKDALVNSLLDQLVTIDHYSDEPDDDPASTQELIALCVNKDFSHMEGLEIGDEIVAAGDSIFMLMDDENNFDALPILEGMKILGTLDFVVVGSIPAIHTVPMILSQTEVYLEDVNPLPTIPYGVALLLKDTLFVSKDGDTTFPPEGLTVIVPLNYDGLTLRRTK